MGPQLPIIYLADKTLKPGTTEWVEVRTDVCKALQDYGCFEVTYNGVSEELKESVLEAMKELFELPAEAKQRNVAPKPYTGYSTHNGLSESMGIDDADILEKVNDFTQLLRPDCEGNESISKTIQTFSEKLADLDVMVRRMVMESFGVEKYIDEHLNSTNYRLRLMKYIAPPDLDANDAAGTNANDGAKIHANADVGTADNADASANAIADAINKVHINDGANSNGDCASVKSNADVGIDANTNTGASVDVGAGDIANVNSDANGGISGGVDVKAGANVEFKVGADDVEKKLGLPAHTDKNLFTIVYQYEIEGLEVKLKDGKWIRPKPSLNFVVMGGDSLHALMNGRISPPYHRVRVTEKRRTRYSVALFSTPKANYVIEPPQELVDEKHPRIFKPFTYVDLMTFFKSEAGRKAPSALHAYCALPGAQSVF